MSPIGSNRVAETESETPERSRPSHAAISAVIAWVNPLELLEPGLRALLSQNGRRPDEIIVVTRHGKAAQERFRELFPSVTLVAAPPGSSIPVLRSMGIQCATGSVVAVTEDHCIPAENWIGTIEKWMAEGCAVVGGPVENDCTHRLRDWAAFLTEYAGVIRPAGADVENGIPGNNVAYRRELLEELRTTLAGERWESFYHERLAAGGVRMVFDRDLLVSHRRPFDFWYFIRQRFHFCRSFAAMRLPQFTAFDRLKYGFGSALLPILLWLRGLRNLLRRRRLVAMYLVCSPLIGIYLCAGACGEMAGYLLGGGNSLRRVE